MRKFSYMIKETDVFFSEKDLNHYGEAGWMLVGFQCDFNFVHFIYIFMKEEEKTDETL